MKAKYFPDREFENKISPLGMVYTDIPYLYHNHILGRTTICVDSLDYAENAFKSIVRYPTDLAYDINKTALRDMLDGRGGTNIFRENLKTLLLNSKFFEFYFLYAMEFSDKSLTPTRRIIAPLRTALDNQITALNSKLAQLPKAKFCMQTDERLYYSCVIPDDYVIGLEHYTEY